MRRDEIGSIVQEIKRSTVQREMGRRAADEAHVEDADAERPTKVGSSRPATPEEAIVAAALIFLFRYRS